jgi:hypothetical protein
MARLCWVNIMNVLKQYDISGKVATVTGGIAVLDGGATHW